MYSRKRKKESFSCRVVKTKAELILNCHFISVVKAMPQEKFLLVLYGHSSHTQSLAAVHIPREHGVAIQQHAASTCHAEYTHGMRNGSGVGIVHCGL
jgi:hypothetical protein